MDEIRSDEALRVWIINHLSRKLAGHAVLRGGMILRILDCPRHTNGIDYVFVPFRSKKEVIPLMEKAFKNLEGLEFSCRFHSTNAQYLVKLSNRHGSFQTQVEIGVAPSCEQEPISTGNFAMQYHQQPEIVSVMRLDVVIAHKLAAWNERNLMRDLYDVYFLHVQLHAKPDGEALAGRLREINYAKKTGGKGRPRQMTPGQFAEKLRQEAQRLQQQDLEEELRDFLPFSHLAGLDKKIRIALNQIAEALETFT